MDKPPIKAAKIRLQTGHVVTVPRDSIAALAAIKEVFPEAKALGCREWSQDFQCWDEWRRC